MDIQEMWEKALRHTEIIRPRVQPLLTFDTTLLPYTLLSNSSGSLGSTWVRKGKVLVESPALWLPPNVPSFEGFEFEKQPEFNKELMMNFLLIRGVKFPSLKYNNMTESLSVYDGTLEKAARYYLDQFQREENVTAGLVSGPEDCWQLSVMILIGTQVIRSADSDIRRLLDRYHKGEDA